MTLMVYMGVNEAINMKDARYEKQIFRQIILFVITLLKQIMKFLNIALNKVV